VSDVNSDATEVPSSLEGFETRALESMWSAFWEPELSRRGGVEVTGPLYAALAVMRPGEPVEIRLNDEVNVVARAREGSSVRVGDVVTATNLDGVDAFEPLGVDPDAGWVVWLVLPDGRQYMRFDFLRNRRRSRRLLDLARDFLLTAHEAVAVGRLGPALENAWAATELVVKARSYSFATDGAGGGSGRNKHSARQHWTKVQVGLGNTTPDAHDTLQALNCHRSAARYGEGDIPDSGVVRPLVASVEALLDDADLRIGQPLRTQHPDFLAGLERDDQID
jgi:hypothetical protein